MRERTSKATKQDHEAARLIATLTPATRRLAYLLLAQLRDEGQANSA